VLLERTLHPKEVPADRENSGSMSRFR